MRARFRSVYQFVITPSRRPWFGSVAVLLLLLALWLLLSSGYRNLLISDKRSEVAASLSRDDNALTVAIDRRAVVLQSLTAYILSHQDEAEMVRETEFALDWLQQNVTGVDYVALAPGGRQRYVFPRAGNEDQVNVDLFNLPTPEMQQAVERTIAQRQIVFGSADHSKSDPARLVAYYAVFTDDKFWGLTSLGLNFQKIVEDTKLEQAQSGLEVVLRDDQGHTFYGIESVFDRDPVMHTVNGLEEDWVLAGVPTAGWEASIQDAFLPFQAAGFSVVGLVTVLVFILMSQQSRLVTAVQKRTEALHNSEAKFRTIVEHSVDGIMLVDEEGLVQEWNRGQVLITGIPREEAVGQYIWDVQIRMGPVALRTPEHRQLVAEYGRHFLTTGQPPDVATPSERPIVRPDGSMRIIQPLPSTIKTDRGYQVVNITRDVTASKQAEIALRQSEVRFRTVADFTYDWEYWQGPDQSILYMSPSGERMTGYPVEEFINDPRLLYNIIYPDDRVRMIEHVHTPSPDGDLLPIDFRITRRDGTLCWIAHVCRPVFDEQGQPLGRRISNRDITSRKQAEESLREQEKLYRSIFETIAEGLAISTLDGVIVEANPAFCAMHGIAVDAVVGQRLLTFIHPTDRYLFAQSVRAVVASESFASQAVNLRQDDQPFHAETRVVGLMYYGQLHMLSIVRDVSVEVGAYLRLEQRVKERTHDLSMLLEFSHSMTRTLEMKPLLRLILDQLRSVVDYTSASILSLIGSEMVVVAHEGPIAESDRRQMRISLNSPLGRAALDPLRPVVISDVHGDGPLARAFQATMGDLFDTTLQYIRSWLGIPLIITGRTVGVVTISHALPNHFTQRHADLALAFANQAALAMENARLYEQAQDLAAMQERQRLARDLHDSVSQTLFSASLAAQVLPRLWERHPEEGQQCLDELSRLTRGALAEMRTLLVELRPNVLVETKLGDLLRQLAEAIVSRTRVPVQVETEGQGVLPPDVQVALYRIAQEALNNVAKHAQANQAVIRLRCSSIAQASDRLDSSPQVGVELTISDDGRGFNRAGIPANHLGLGIMRERADAIRAVLSIESQIGGGTQVVVRWPQPQESD